MGRLSQSDLRGIFGFLGTAAAGTATEPISRATLVTLGRLLDADEVEYFELRRADRAVLGLATSAEITSAPGTDEALAVYGHENPLNWRRWRPAHGALRLSASMARGDLQRLGFYDAYLRPNGVTDILKVWLWSTDSSVACVQLWRGDGSFSRRDQDVLTVLRHHLEVLARGTKAAGAAAARSNASLTVREAEILTWAATGESDAAIADRLGLSEATVGKHLEHAYAALGVHSRTEAIGRLMRTPPQAPPSI